MATDENYWINRAQSAEAKLTTIQSNQDRLKEENRTLLQTFAAKKRSDGTFDIDFEKLVGQLSLEHALALRAEIDRQHRVSGAAGEKPRVSVPAA